MNFDEEKLPEMPVKDWVGQPKQSEGTFEAPQTCLAFGQGMDE